MGVVKNLMVRVGADVRGFTSGMKTASNATKETKENIQKNTNSIKKIVSGSFRGVGSAIETYSESIKNTRQTHEVAKQNVTRLSDQVESLKNTFTTVKEAMAGLDLAKPLTRQIEEAEKATRAIDKKMHQVFLKMQSINTNRQSGRDQYSKLAQQLDMLAEEGAKATEQLEKLRAIEYDLGSKKVGYASAAGLEKLQQQIVNAENELRTTQYIVEETERKLQEMGTVGGYAVGRAFGGVGQMVKGLGSAALSKTAVALRSVGTAAKQAAVNGIRRLGTGLKSLGTAAVRGITSLPGKLLRIGRAATSGSGGVKRLVQQIRNIGVVSLGMRVAGAIFGRLRSIISNYISTNDELNAATSMLTKQMGQALEPAIRLVIAAMQQLMPAVQRVSAGVSSVLKAIIGEVGDVRYAFRQLGTYGFDQITKSDDGEENSTGATAQSALVQKLVGWIDQLKAAFTAGDWRKLGNLVGDGINSVFDAINAVDVGRKIGVFTANLFTTLHGVFTTVDFTGIGKTAATLLNEAVAQIDWAIVGETIGHALLAVPRILAGFVTGADWQQTAAALTECLNSVFAVINSIDVIGKVGAFAGNLVNTMHNVFTKIDFSGIGKTTAKLLNAAIRQINWAKAGEIIGKALLAIPDVLVGFVLETDWAKVGQAASECVRSALGTINKWLQTTDWLEIGKSAAELIGNIDWSGIVSDMFTGLGAALGASVSLLWGALEGVVTSIKEYFGKKIEEAGGNVGIGFLHGIVDGLGNIGEWVSKNIASPFKEGFRGVGNGVVDVVEDMVNSIISGLNDLFSAIYAGFTIANLGYVPSDIPTISSVTLPRAARGGVVDGPTQLIAGEKGKEAIVPLENNTEWINKVADKVSTKITGGAGGKQPMILQIFLGKRKLTEYVIQDINQITASTGVCPIKA